MKNAGDFPLKGGCENDSPSGLGPCSYARQDFSFVHHSRGNKAKSSGDVLLTIGGARCQATPRRADAALPRNFE